jgi:integrase
VRAILAEVARLRPELTAFFGCLYYAALRPEEAVALGQADLILPAHGRGTLILTGACPRTGSAWTGTGTPYEPRGLKHRPDGTVRVVPIPPVLAGLLRQHLREHGTTPDGRLFRGVRGGILSESTYGRVWHAPATPRSARIWAPRRWPGARMTCGMPHCPGGWTPDGAPAEVAARAGNKVHVLQAVYAHCIEGRDEVIGRQIEDALDPDSSGRHRSPRVTACGLTHRRHRPDPVRHMSVNDAAGPRVAHAKPVRHTRTGPGRCVL